MRTMGAQEAANEIRGVIHSDLSSRVAPEEQHQLKYLKEVCNYLGVEPSAENVLHVRSVLREHDIAPYSGDEWPKWVVRKWDNTQHIAHNEQEADEIVNVEPPPEPAPAPRVIEPPVQNPDLDLKDKVPHTVGGETAMAKGALLRTQTNPGDRQPSDITKQVPPAPRTEGKSDLDKATDREAAQGQKPLDGMENVGDEVVVVDDTSGVKEESNK